MSLEENTKMDLDDLDEMDLDSLDDMSLDDADLSSFGEVDTTIPFPHVRIQTKQLQNLLRIAKLLSAASGRDVVSKSISFHVEDGRLVCRATDFDSYLVQKFDIMNEENVLDEDFVIPIDILMKLSKACPATTAIIKDEEGLKMRLAGGDIILETYTVQLDKYKLADKYSRVSEVEAPSLLAIVRSMSPIVTSAVNPTERRIVFKRGNAYSSYMWALVTALGSYPNFELKVKDLAIMKALLTNLDGTVVISKTDEGTKVSRTVLSTEDFVYATITSTVEMSDTMINQMSEIVGGPSAHVDLIQLFKMVEVSADLPYSVGKIGINYNDEGVSLSIKTKKGKDSIFSISGSFEGRPAPLGKEVVLQSKLLRILLRSFAGSPSVKLYITEKGLGLETEALQACCFIEG